MRLASGRSLAQLLAATASVAPVAAQDFTASRSGGTVIELTDGRVAVLDQRDDKILVIGVVEAQAGRPAGVDIRIGDVVIALQGIRPATLADVDRVYRAISEGSEVTVALKRGEKEHVIRFARPKSNGQQLAIRAKDARSAGAWTTAEGSNAGLVIAGANLRDNNAGMPEVTHLTTDPAGMDLQLRAGDVITGINGRSIAALAGLRKLYSEAVSGSTITLTVARDGQTIQVRFTKTDP